MAPELKPLTELAEKSDIVVYEGITTSVGDIGGNTVVDSGLTQANNYWNNMVVHIKSGNSNDQVRRISGFVQATGTITVDTAFSTQIAIGTQYDILGQYAGPSGGGGDATAANQVLILADTNAILLDTAEIGAAGAGLTAVAQASVCLEARLAELDAANLPTDVANVKTDTAAILIDTAEIGAAGAGLTAVAQASVCTAARLAELDAANLPVDIDTINSAVGAIEGATSLHNKLTAARAGYLDELAAANIPADIDLLKSDLSGTELEGTAATLNAYSGTATSTETGADVFIISTTTRKKIHFLGVQISGLTAGATATLRMYTKMLDADASLTKFYSEIFTVGTNVPFVPVVNGTIAIRNNVRVEIKSNNPADTSISAKYHYILETME